MLNTDMLGQPKRQYKDRYEAGSRLADELVEYKDGEVVVLALPRGGVPLGYQVAKKINAPLSVLVSRKIGAPGHEEYGVGAISEGGILYLDKKALSNLQITKSDLHNTIEKEKKELQRRVEAYRHGRELPELSGKTVILVDDGLATGVTARVAIRSARKHGASEVILAVPVCASQSMDDLKSLTDRVVCLLTPGDLRAIGYYYQDFGQISDEEVTLLLDRAEDDYGGTN